MLVSNKCVNFNRQLSVFICNNISCIMGGKPKFYGIPYILPLRVMIHLFGFQGYPGHKCKCFAEIGELKFFIKFIVGFFPHTASFISIKKVLKKQGAPCD